MKISDVSGLAFRNLSRRLGRTALTVIGVVVGSCAVVVMISLGIAQNKANEEMLASWGDLTQVMVYNFGHSVGQDNKTPPALTDKQLQKLKSWDHVLAVSPFYQPYTISGTISAGRNGRYQTNASTLMGVYMSAMPAMGYELASGAWPDDTQSYGNDKIPVVIPTSVAYMFEDSRRGPNSSKRVRYQGQTDAAGNPLSPFIDLNKDTLTLTITNNDTANPKTKSWQLVVVGTLDFGDSYALNNWSSYAIGVRASDLTMIMTAAAKLTSSTDRSSAKAYDSISIKVDDINNVDAISKSLKDLGYTVSSMTEQRDAMKQQVGRSQLMLGGLAAISLLVAALNIANTMTMAIYERTKEIGVMKVLGCEINDIRVEFLMESGAMGLIGGIIGGGVSLLVSLILNNISMIAALFGQSVDLSGMTGMSDYSYMMGGSSSMVISIVPWWLLLSTIAFATVIGLLSGLGPANKAVRISALEAISHD